MEHVVSRPELESGLAAVQRLQPDPNDEGRAGIFGPASMTWKLSRESAVFLGAGRAALLQLAHPWVTAALAQHSNLMNRPIDRFHNTFRIVFTMIFGSSQQAMRAARHLHTLHTRIQGQLPEPVAGWPRATHYAANEVAALRWVYATLVESAVLACESVVPLSAADRERYYRESHTMAALFGIPEEVLPPDWAGFSQYSRRMAESSELGVDATARKMAKAILSGAGSWVHPPRWYRALTTEWLPPRLREEFELHPDARDQRAAEQARRWFPKAYAALPETIRFVGPYHEAQARLAGRHPGWLTRQSNRFWIGQPNLPFGK